MTKADHRAAREMFLHQLKETGGKPPSQPPPESTPSEVTPYWEIHYLLVDDDMNRCDRTIIFNCIDGSDVVVE